MDAFGFPAEKNSDVQIFYATGGVNTQGFQSWIKPQGVSMVFMFTIAGGGGGGGGRSNVTSSNRGGGAGGACSGLARFLCPALFLPDLLYIQVGSGGLGGAAGAAGGNDGIAGGNGINSYILTSKTAVLPNIVCYSGVNVPGGGAGGTAAGGVSGGTIPTVALTQPLNALGEWFSIAGLTGGTAGTLGSAGAAVTAWGQILTSPGVGAPSFALAGNTAIAGNGQGATALTDCGSQLYVPTGAGAIATGGSSTAPNGGSGVKRLTPFFNCGGAAGAAIDGTAGNGGNGGWGCGGGGGGGGIAAGNGGAGGDGLVIIISW